MQRRSYLAVLGTGVLGGLAGVARGGLSPPVAEHGPDVDVQRATVAMPEPVSDDDLPVPKDELRQALAQDAKPAIVDPAFGSTGTDGRLQRESVRDADESAGDADETPELRAHDEVLGVEIDGQARAYPLNVLNRHEVVNDDFGDPLLVTYCPVCRSGVVADRRVDGEAHTFGVSGLLYGANLVLYDEETETLWSQLWATAIRGELVGERLDLLPARTTTWRRWHEEYPDTEVLLPPPASGTVVGDVSLNYDLDIYGERERVAERYPEYGPLGDLEWSDTRLRRRDLVVAVVLGETVKAYSRNDVRGGDPINDSIEGVPVVVTYAGDDTMVAYDRRVDGDVLRFETDEDGDLVADGSRWNRLTGRAPSGPHEGSLLSPVPSLGTLYWAAVLEFYPEATVYGRDNT